jgi:hypothetical protein
MDEFRAKYLQTFLQFLDLMLNISFDGGNFMKTVADVNVHSASALLTKCATKCFLKPIVHPVEKSKRRIESLFTWDDRPRQFVAPK